MYILSYLILFLLIGTKEWKLSINFDIWRWIVNIFHSLDHRTSIISPIQNPAAAENKDNYIVESDDKQHIYETNLAYLYGVLDKVPYIFDSYLLIIFICFIL